MTLVLTGFEPFGGAETNPSQMIADTLSATWGGKETLVSATLPVTYSGAGDAIIDLIARHQPRAVLMVGLAGEATLPRLERVALNINEAKIADNAGDEGAGRRIVSGAPLALQTRLDLPALKAHLENQGHGVEVSNHAGTYVCNHIYFLALWRLYEMGSPATCLFLHVPKAPDVPGKAAAYFKQMQALTHSCLSALSDTGRFVTG